MFAIALLAAFISLIGWLYLAFGHGLFWLPLFAEQAADPIAWPSVDIIVPARDEASILPESLPGLLAQDYPGAWRLLIVDDHSSDGTTAAAYDIAGEKGRAEFLTVIAAPDLHKGWRGKPHAMQAAVAKSEASFILFTDADIHHPPDSLRRLVAQAESRGLDLVSLMAKLNCKSWAEKLVIPAFVFFFGLLYPFRRARDPDSTVAAAAGGCMLVRRIALNRAGGLSRIKGELIDDCALAYYIKRYGGPDKTNGKIDLRLAHDVLSLRPNPHIKDVWGMIRRTAFTQLKHSSVMLLVCLLGMAIMFMAPPLLVLFGGLLPHGIALVAAGSVAGMLMLLVYLPMVNYYGLRLLWAAGLPLAAVLYMGATFDSARLYWAGKGGQWKGRVLT